MKLAYLVILILTLSGCAAIKDTDNEKFKSELAKYPSCRTEYNNITTFEVFMEKDRYNTAVKCMEKAKKKADADALQKEREREKKDALNRYPSCEKSFSNSHDAGMYCFNWKKSKDEHQAYLKTPEGIAATQKAEVLNSKNLQRCEYYLNDIKQKYVIASAKVRTANGGGKTVICTYMITQPTSYGTNVQNIIVVQGNFINNVYTIRD